MGRIAAHTSFSVFGLTAAYPLGVLFALGRQSKMPAIKTICIVYIELIRGVPLITLLFMSSVVFPLFLPEGFTIKVIIRAQVAIILFTAAYIAEVVRGRTSGYEQRAVRGRRVYWVEFITRPCDWLYCPRR